MNQRRDLRFWNWTAHLYGPFMKRWEGMYQEMAAEIGAYLSRDEDILELACGSGQLSFRLAHKARLWEATDYSPKMIAEARKRVRSCRLHFSVQDATALPYAPESFDGVVIANALHILSNPDGAMREIHRVLKPGGWLFAPTFTWREGNASRVRQALLTLAGFKAYRQWDRAGLTSYIQTQGFAIVSNSMLSSGLAPLCCPIARKQ